MKFDYCLYGFKNFKENAKEIFDLKDIFALILLFFSFGLLLSKAVNRISAKVKTIFALFALLTAVPAIIKTVVAALAGISSAGHRYLN